MIVLSGKGSLNSVPSLLVDPLVGREWQQDRLEFFTLQGGAQRLNHGDCDIAIK